SKPALSMYRALPDGEIAIEEFERFAMDRLRVLKGIEDLKVKGFRFDQMEPKILELYEQHMGGATSEERHRKDIISHFVLRLAYCSTDDLRRWLLAQECDLFRARFNQMLADEQVPQEFSEELREKLLQVLMSLPGVKATAGMVTADSFYKVPFEQVPDLVASRRVYLQAGFAYVSRDQMSSLVIQPFRAALSKALTVTARRWEVVVAPGEADRLAPMVQSLSRRYLGPDFSNREVDDDKRPKAADIPRLARESFPLCMATMYDALHEKHHLKHDGRLQFRLFLKGIGLPLDQALHFWRTEMAPVTPTEKFTKEYEYGIKHSYGKEGKRTDYTPYTCAKIVSSIPGVDQVHGCPYRTFNQQSLRSALGRLQVSPAKIEEAVGKAAAGHYQLACAAAWEGKHGCSCDSGINHPNQYFEESRKALQ
ncbi:hypothetical protein CHLNCDRAFT_8099, partial [Chlorella variabilis]